MSKPSILFLCRKNSCRSQMAEGLMRHLAGDQWEVYSAGLESSFVDPRAIAALAEIGIDASAQESNTLEEMLSERQYDLMVAVCAAADESCPVVPGAKRRESWPFEDPADAEGDEAQQAAEFARVRDQIKAKIEAFVAANAAS